MPAPLLQLLYRSRSTHPIGHQSDLRILRVALRDNDVALITGFLLRTPDRFFQVLEGPERAVRQLIERIRKDSDHHNLDIIFSRGTGLRRFGEWTMGYAELAAKQIDLLNLQCDGNEDPDRILKEFEILAVAHQFDLLAQAKERALETP